MHRNSFLMEAFLAVCDFGYIICWTLEPSLKQKHSSIGLTEQGSLSRSFIVKELGVYQVCENMRNLAVSGIKQQLTLIMEYRTNQVSKWDFFFFCSLRLYAYTNLNLVLNLLSPSVSQQLVQSSAPWRRGVKEAVTWNIDTFH